MSKKFDAHTHTHTHTHNEVLLSGKKNEFFPFATTWMDLEGVMLSEIDREKQISYDSIHV